jgi:hypothetical protein
MTKKKKEKEKEKETKQNIDVYDARSPRSQWKDETGVIFNCLVKKGNLCQDIVRIIFDYGIVVPELYQGRLTQTLFSARCYKSSGDNKFWPIITRSPARPLKLVCTSGHTMETQITRSHLQFEFVNSHALEVEVQPDRPRTFCLPWITGSQVFGPNFTFVRDADLDCHFKWRRTHSPPNCWCHPISVPKSENDAFVLWVIEV